jgi:hypothetical protein
LEFPAAAMPTLDISGSGDGPEVNAVGFYLQPLVCRQSTHLFHSDFLESPAMPLSLALSCSFALVRSLVNTAHKLFLIYASMSSF